MQSCDKNCDSCADA